MFKAATAMKMYYEFDRSWGIISMLSSLQKQLQRCRNRYTSPKIDVFRMAILMLLAPTGDNARASFLVQQVPGTSVTVLRYR